MSFTMETHISQELMTRESASSEALEIFGNAVDATAYTRLTALQANDTKSDLSKALVMVEWHDAHKDEGKAVWQTILDKAGLKRSYGAQYVKVGEIVRAAMDEAVADDIIGAWIGCGVTVAKLYELRAMSPDTIIGFYLSGVLTGYETQKELREINSNYKANKGKVDSVLASDGEPEEIVNALVNVSKTNIDKDNAVDMEPSLEVAWYTVAVRAKSSDYREIDYVAPNAIKSLKRLTTINRTGVVFETYMERATVDGYTALVDTHSYLYYAESLNEYIYVDVRPFIRYDFERNVCNRLLVIQKQLEAGEIDAIKAGEQIKEATEMPDLLSYKDLEKVLAQ